MGKIKSTIGLAPNRTEEPEYPWKHLGNRMVSTAQVAPNAVSTWPIMTGGLDLTGIIFTFEVKSSFNYDQRS